MATLEFFILLKIFAILSATSRVQGLPNDDKASLFVFGDSLFDPGNNKYINASFAATAPYVWPYGETFFGHPTGRYSGGRVIPDFIADYMKLPFPLPYLQPGSNNQFMYGCNFASGGSGALSETNPGSAVNGLRTQLSQFKNVEKNLREKLGDVETKKLLSRAIYLFHAGANDYFVRVENATVLRSISKNAYVEIVIGNLTAVVKGIYEMGGRKFGVLNTPPYWLAPVSRAFLSKEASMESVEMVKLHNAALSKTLKQLKKYLKAFEYSEFDFFTSLGNLIKSPSKYGFKEGKEGCCGSGPYRGDASCGEKGFELCGNANNFVFFDSSHPTDHANKEFAAQIWSGNSRPTNLKTLFQI